MKDQAPVELDEAKKHITHWRQTRTKLRPIPELVWDAVLPLVDKYSHATISKELGLSYEQLRSKLAERKKQSQTARNSFVAIDLPQVLSNEKTGSYKIHLSKPDGMTLIIDGANQQLIHEMVSYFMRPSC
jgi:hypothetical protein